MPVFTEVLPIPSQPGASFQLPSTEDVKIMAVRVTIDNSGGTDTEPELAMLAPTGAVIATERQSEAIPAGDSGMASWALRLAKKTGGKGAGAMSWCTATTALNEDIPAGPSGAGYFDLETNDPATFSLTTHFFPQLAFNAVGTYLVFGAYRAVSDPLAPIANPWTTTLQGGPGNFPGPPFPGPHSTGNAIGSHDQVWTTTWLFKVDIDAGHIGGSMDWNWNNLAGADLHSALAGVAVLRLSDVL